MATSKADGAPPKLALEPVESSATGDLTERDTPRILVHDAGIALTASNDLATAFGHESHVSQDGHAVESLPSYVLSGVSAGYADGNSSVMAQSAPSNDKHSRRDSIIKPSHSSNNLFESNHLSSPLSALDTTSGADSDVDYSPTPFRRRRSFLHHDASPVVQSPIDDATQGGAQPQHDSEEDVTFSSVNTSFDSNEAAYEEARQHERPYTNSLGPPPRWDQGPSPEPTDVISDAGDQQELQLRHKQSQAQRPEAVRKHFNIEESVASLPADNSDDDLPTKIHDAFIQTRRKRGDFLPKGMLCSLVNPASVAEELNNKFAGILTQEAIQRYAEKICSETEVTRRGKLKIKSFRKIFALLVVIDSTQSILQVLAEDVSDLDLPLTLVKYNGIHGLCRRDAASQSEGVPLKSLRKPHLALIKLKNFADYQWKLLAPFFSQDLGSEVKHYKLNDKHILPFIPLDDMADEDTERVGGYGRVDLVDIHPDHHNFHEDSLGCKGFAVKQQLHDDNRDYFKKEMIILKKFSGERKHPHIVSLLATYEQFKKFHLIFSRAEGDLFTFWKEFKRRPQINQRNILWMVGQCRGITDGLLKLHRLLSLPKNQGGMHEESSDELAELSHQAHPHMPKAKGVKFSDHIQERVRTDSWERPASPLCTPEFISAYSPHPVAQPSADKEDESHAKKYGRHGDINPGNILWFGDDSEDQERLSGTLKLADFGQAELNSALTKTQPKTVANTMTYRPPECDLQHKPIRQSYDIWCLGCVFLEFVAWMLGGRKLLNEFSIKRLSPDIFFQNEKTDTFFQVTTKVWTPTPEVVEVKKSVIDFIEDLHRHAKCTDFIHELLIMIKEKMLLVESSERKSCEAIWRCLDEMYQKCHDADYAASSNPWRIGSELWPKPVELDQLHVTRDIEKELKYLPLRPRHHGARQVRRFNTGRVERRPMK